MKHSYTIYDPSLLNLMDTSANQQALVDRYNGVFSPLEISAEEFNKAYELPIGDFVEKNYKGLSYLSWPFAFRYLKAHFPMLYVAFEEAKVGWPVFGEPGCYILRPYLTDGIRRTVALVFPIMDNKHNAVKELDGRQISDNIQRASVKAIATFTGLGLKLYAGEDIPKEEEAIASTAKAAPAAKAKKAEPPAQESNGEEAKDASAFDGKAWLLAFCKANPFNYPEERTSLKAGKNALEAIGLAKGEDLKDASMFSNVVTTMVSSWVKESEITITKSAMMAALDPIRNACSSGVDSAVEAVKEFVAGKK